MGNLLHNSLKFTPKGGTIKLQLELHDESALITVEDSGIGIDPEILPSLFKPFVQAPQSIDRRHGGLGLGLSVVKGLLDLHAGTVFVESQGKGMGCRFQVKLPVDHSSGPFALQVLPKNESLFKILLVEDQPDAALSLKKLLEVHGHQVLLATCGTEGLSLAMSEDPDAVICDIGLPDLDGYEVAKKLRQIPKFKSLHLIALTGYGQAADVNKAFEAGFDSHLTKPTSILAITEALNRV